MATQQFCTFFIKDHFFGVPVSDVQEVIRYQDITQVPLAPMVIRGLINLRGQIAMAMDLRARLSFDPRPPEMLPINVVVRCSDGAISFLVDEIGDVVEVEETSFEPPPDSLRGELREAILGVHKLPDRLMHVLDVTKTAELTELRAK